MFSNNKLKFAFGIDSVYIGKFHKRKAVYNVLLVYPCREINIKKKTLFFLFSLKS